MLHCFYFIFYNFLKINRWPEDSCRTVRYEFVFWSNRPSLHFSLYYGSGSRVHNNADPDPQPCCFHQWFVHNPYGVYLFLVSHVLIHSRLRACRQVWIFDDSRVFVVTQLSKILYRTSQKRLLLILFSVLRIWDVYPGSWMIFIHPRSRISDCLL